MEKEIKEVIHTLADVFQKESEEKYIDWAEKVIKEYDYLDIKKPEDFSLLSMNTIERKKGLLSRIALNHIELDRKEKFKLEFVYENYHFIKRHLESVILKYEGMMCSADKTRWLIDQYAKHIVSKEIPKVEEKKYWHPKIEDVSLWFRWMDTMSELYYGDEKKYVEIKTEVVKIYENLSTEFLERVESIFKKDGRLLKVELLDDKKQYTFFDEETNDKAEIFVNTACEISYRFYDGKQKKYLRSNDEKPTWFLNLLNI